MKVSSNSYNAIVNIYSSNVIFDEAYKKFREELNKISKEMKYTITDKISPFLTFVSDIKLNKLFINITSSNSVFFRFSDSRNDYEYKLEIFFDYNYEDEEDIEAVLNIYEKGVKINSYFGSAESLYGIIYKLNQTCVVYGMDRKSIENNNSFFFKKGYSSQDLSFALNTYQTEQINFFQRVK